MSGDMFINNQETLLAEYRLGRACDFEVGIRFYIAQKGLGNEQMMEVAGVFYADEADF